MKFKDIIKESNSNFNFRSIDFNQISIDSMLNAKFHTYQESLGKLLKLVKKIKSEKIYAFFGIGTMSHVWDYIMFIYQNKDKFKLIIYRDMDEVKEMFKTTLSEMEYIKLINKFGKRWNFDEELVYRNK